MRRERTDCRYRTNHQERTAGCRSRHAERKSSFARSLVRFTGGLMLTLAVMAGCFLSGNLFSSAHEPAGQESAVCYKSIEIRHGDSLWSIAEQYAEYSYCESVADYTRELAEINGISPEQADSLQTGDYLTVFYTQGQAADIL